jgi:hypothetical protein
MAASDVFAGTKSRWVEYDFDLLIHTLCGGIPSDAKTIESHIRARLDLGDAAIKALAEEAIEQMEWRNETPSSEQLDELVAKIATDAVSVNSFKKVDGQLVYEGRCMKAALVEAASVCFPNRSWPSPKPEAAKELHGNKGFRSWFIETVEVADRYIPLGREMPDVLGEQRIGHVNGPKGKQAMIKQVDIITDAKIHGTIRVMDDAISEQTWRDLWEYVENGGVGADRSRGDGRSELLAWKKVKKARGA